MAGMARPSWADAVTGEPESRSVYQISSADGWIIGATAVATGAAYALMNPLIYIPPSVNSNQVNPLDRQVIGNRNIFMDNLSDFTVGLIVAAPIGLDWLEVGWNRTFAEDMTVYAETLSINTALTTLFKFTVQRPLPRVYAGTDPELSSTSRGYDSFYSGHTSLAFAALSASAMTLGFRHQAGAWPWLVTVVLGTSVAAERVSAGQHFYTDVIVGAVMGTAVGVLVPEFHRWNSVAGGRVTLKPVADGAGFGWTRRF
jgi:membrane-associated phospholipid phosphatase